jgi:hypothetical protein
MFYPVDVPGLVQSALIGANGSDPTIPYSPGWPRRLGSSLWSIARRNQRQSPQAPCSTTSSPATT